MKPADLGQRIEDFLCDTIAEVFLIVLRAEISERQDGDRANPRFSFLSGLSGLWSGPRELTPCGRFLYSNNVQTNGTYSFQ